MNLRQGLWRLWVVLTLAVSGPCTVVAILSHQAAEAGFQSVRKLHIEADAVQRDIYEREQSLGNVSRSALGDDAYVNAANRLYALASKDPMVVMRREFADQASTAAREAAELRDLLTPIAIGFPLALGALILGALWVHKGFNTPTT